MKGLVTADSLKAEIVALTRQIETLKRQLVRVNDEARAERGSAMRRLSSYQAQVRDSEAKQARAADSRPSAAVFYIV